MLTGHLHRYGQRLTLERLGQSGSDTSRVIWSVTPQGDPNTDSPLPVWTLPTPFWVSPTDRFRLTADYDNVSGTEWPAMAAIGAYVLSEHSSDAKADESSERRTQEGTDHAP